MAASSVDLPISFKRHLRGEHKSVRTVETYLEAAQQLDAFLRTRGIDLAAADRDDMAGSSGPTVAAAPAKAPYLKSCRRLILGRCVVVPAPITLSPSLRSPSERLSTSEEAAPLIAAGQA